MYVTAGTYTINGIRMADGIAIYIIVDINTGEVMVYENKGNRQIINLVRV